MTILEESMTANTEMTMATQCALINAVCITITNDFSDELTDVMCVFMVRIKQNVPYTFTMLILAERALHI